MPDHYEKKKSDNRSDSLPLYSRNLINSSVEEKYVSKLL